MFHHTEHAPTKHASAEHAAHPCVRTPLTTMSECSGCGDELRNDIHEAESPMEIVNGLQEECAGRDVQNKRRASLEDEESAHASKLSLIHI